MTEANQEHDQLTRRMFDARRTGDVEFLAACLGDPTLQHGAAKFLGETGDSRAIEPLLKFLAARDSGLRVIVIQALSALGAVEVVPRLLEVARNDKEPFLVRSWAIDAVGKLGNARDARSLIVLLHDPNWRVRRLAARALAVVGSGESVDPLRQAMAQEHWYRRRPYMAALRALER